MQESRDDGTPNLKYRPNISKVWTNGVDLGTFSIWFLFMITCQKNAQLLTSIQHLLLFISSAATFMFNVWIFLIYLFIATVNSLFKKLKLNAQYLNYSNADLKVWFILLKYNSIYLIIGLFHSCEKQHVCDKERKAQVHNKYRTPGFQVSASIK